jgi:hypothetical protein
MKRKILDEKIWTIDNIGMAGYPRLIVLYYSKELILKELRKR